MGEEGRSQVILQNGQKKETKKEKTSPFGRKNPEHEHISKMKRVLVIESDSHMMILIEDQLKEACLLKCYKCVNEVEMAMTLLDSQLNIVIIGPMFRDNNGELGTRIKNKFPQIKVIKLAGTSEHKRITSEFPAVGKGRPYDEVIQFSRIGELKVIVGKE
jgi:hypothetical protein